MIDEQKTLERGMRMYKEYMLEIMKQFCEQPYESAALMPRTYTQGQMMSADKLLEYVKQQIQA